MRSPLHTVDFESKILVRQTCESLPLVRYTASPIEPTSELKEPEVAKIEEEESVLPQSDIIVSEQRSRIQSTGSNQKHPISSTEKKRMSFLKTKIAQPEKSLGEKNAFRSEAYISSPYSKAWDQSYLKSQLTNLKTEPNEKSLTKSELPNNPPKQIPNGQLFKTRTGTNSFAGGSYTKDNIGHTSTPNIYHKTFKATRKENQRLLKTILKPVQNLLIGKKFSHESIKLNSRTKKQTDSSISINRDESANHFSTKQKIDAGSFQNSYTASLAKNRTAWTEKHEDYMSHFKPRMGKSEDKDSLSRLRYKEFQI